jgi:uncharacterized protein YhhL (DUF1145 family)
MPYPSPHSAFIFVSTITAIEIGACTLLLVRSSLPKNKSTIAFVAVILGFVVACWIMLG